MAKRARRTTPNNVFSHWFKTIGGFKALPSDFYKAVESKIAEHQIPNLQVVEIACKEGGFLSAKRIYLRVTRKDKIFDICGAPFGSGFFISWWLGEKPTGLLRQIAILLAFVPLIGIPFRSFIEVTYFQIDTMLMFQQAVHTAVTEAIDEMMTTQGLMPLTELDKKPIMNL